MSALDLIPAAELASEPVTKPPTRWRNWFHSDLDAVWGNGDIYPAGKWCSPNLYATQALAEEAAEQSMLDHADWVRAIGIFWLGAYPDGERP